MNKLRFALRDSAANPQYIETVPRTGYRFVYPVQRTNLRVMPAPELPVESVPETTPVPARRNHRLNPRGQTGSGSDLWRGWR